MDDDTDAVPDDEMRRRVSGGRLKLWLLQEASRWAVAGVLLTAVFLVLVTLGSLDIFTGLGKADPIETTFQAFLSAIITGVTLVVTINQLVLSQELGAVGDQRERMEEAMSFRHDAESMLDRSTSPPDPATFLQALIDRSASAAADLEAATTDAPEDVRNHVEGLVGAVRANADDVGDQLEGASFGTFDVLSAALNYNYSWKLYHARRLRNEHGDTLDDEAMAALDTLVDTLTQFGPAREHVKTLYFQWELINLSRTMLYTAVPAIIATLIGVLYLDPAAIQGSLLGVNVVVWVVASLAVVALLPFALLGAYVLRIATVAKRTLAIGPFILRDSDE